MNSYNTKEISKSSFQGGHVAVIVFHILVGLYLFLCLHKWKENPKHVKFGKIVCGVLVVVSILGLVPVLLNDRYSIQ